MKTLAHNLLKTYARSFPLNKGKRRVVSSAWKLLSFGEHQRETNLKGNDIKMSCDLTKDIQRQIYFFGGYEEELTQIWSDMSGESSTIFDVGANVGLYSLLAARKKPTALVHAFEPTPALVEIIKTNLKLNGLQNVVLNMAAVGQAPGQAFLHRCAGANQSNEGMNFVSQTGQDEFDVATEVVALDDYCQQRGITSIALLKMDIEGSEYNAILGCQTLLQNKAIGCIFMELVEWDANRSGNSTTDIKKLLWKHGYQMYSLEHGKLTLITDEGIGETDNVISFAQPPKLLANRIA